MTTPKDIRPGKGGGGHPGTPLCRKHCIYVL